MKTKDFFKKFISIFKPKKYDFNSINKFKNVKLIGSIIIFKKKYYRVISGIDKNNYQIIQRIK